MKKLIMVGKYQVRTVKSDNTVALAGNMSGQYGDWSKQSIIGVHGSATFDAAAFAEYYPKTVTVKDGKVYPTAANVRGGVEWTRERIVEALTKYNGLEAVWTVDGNHRAAAAFLVEMTTGREIEPLTVEMDATAATAAAANFSQATFARMGNVDSIRATVALIDAGRVKKVTDMPCKYGMAQRLYYAALLVKAGQDAAKVARLDKEEARKVYKDTPARDRAATIERIITGKGDTSTRAIAAPTLRATAAAIRADAAKADEPCTLGSVAALLVAIADGDATAYEALTGFVGGSVDAEA